MPSDSISSSDKFSPGLHAGQVFPETTSSELGGHRKSACEEPTLQTGKALGHRSLNVAYIGMGPNALWNALQLKAKRADADIEMFEKRTEYVRTHTVRIDDNCFRSLKNYDNQILKDGITQLGNKIRKRHGHISCKEFEQDLKSIAERMGIIMHAGSDYEVISIGDGKINFNSGKAFFDALVCADGAHSQSRKALLKMADNPNYQGEDIDFSELSSIDEASEFKAKRDLQYRVRVKYQVRGATKKLASGWLNFFRYAYATFKMMLSPVDEKIRKLSDQKNEVTIDFFISKEEFESLADYNLANPGKLSDSKISGKLKVKITNWLAIKHKFCQETIIPGTEEVSPYILSIFHARKVQHVTPSGKLICIAGDAATSLPYFRSLNNFMVVGADLGRKLGSAYKEDLAETGAAYEKYASRRARWEGVKAKFKNLMINVLKLYFLVSNRVLWQTNAWNPEKLEGMRKQLPEREASCHHSTAVLTAE